MIRVLQNQHSVTRCLTFLVPLSGFRLGNFYINKIIQSTVNLIDILSLVFVKDCGPACGDICDSCKDKFSKMNLYTRLNIEINCSCIVHDTKLVKPEQ